MVDHKRLADTCELLRVSQVIIRRLTTTDSLYSGSAL